MSIRFHKWKESRRKGKAGDQKTSAEPEKKTTASVDEVGDAYLGWLYALWDHLQTLTDHKINLKQLAQFGIRHQHLTLNDTRVDPLAIQTTFFIPMAKKEVQAYLPDDQQPETVGLLKHFGDWPS